MPASNLMIFDDNCGNDSQILSKFAKPCIGGVCVEELVVVGEQYAMVRGCHSILMGYNNYTTTLNMTKPSACYYGEISGSVIYQNTPYFEPKIGVHFCNDIDLCNNMLSTNYSMFYETGWDECETLPVTTCVSCEDYNGIGDCNNETQNCTGSWCTSVIGKIDDLPFITKGCAPYNPLSLNNASCVNISTSLIIGEMGDRITQVVLKLICMDDR
uniref:Uncharacterized protein n=1 Tax=Acrobeloides nanus TaxID=290746 RepID=A0A914CXE3_9BILA